MFRDRNRYYRGKDMIHQEKDDIAIVLDFLPNGYPLESKPIFKNPVVQLLGKQTMQLLDAVVRKEVHLKPLQEVYIGKGKREEIKHIIGRLNPKKLTETAKANLREIVAKLISENEKKYVEFFNKAQPLTTRMHSLELLPGLGKKHMWLILDQREEEPFKSFEDISERVKLHDPKKMIIDRVIHEIINPQEKHYIFVRRYYS